MREIEIKVRLTSLEQTLKQLHAVGVTLSDQKEQHDVVYCLPEDKLKENDPGVNWLRIRTENKTTTYLTLKRSVAGSLDSIEHETTVADGAELATMMSYMRYEVFSDLVKIRRTGHYGDIEICVDELPQLGSFLELEKMCEEDTDGALVEKELLELLDTLGIEHSERMTKGYDELMNEYEATRSGERK